MKQVLKASGEYQNFNSKKIYYTILDSGASKKLAKETERLIAKKYYKGITTKEILDIILENLKKEPGVSQRYDLKRAVMSLGPSGFPFEIYFAKILENYNYKTKVDNIIPGKIILHEVDIIAEKNKKKYMIECKYHNEIGVHTKLHVAMYTYARFLDVKKYDIPWLVTNTKCVDVALDYAKGVGLKITSWNYPKIDSLKSLIENKKLYPITSIKSIDYDTKEKLFATKIIIAKDILNYTNKELVKITTLNEDEIKKIKKEIRDILND